MTEDASAPPDESAGSDIQAILKKAFASDSLRFALWEISKGRHIGPERVAAIKAANPSWATDENFSRYVDRTHDGRKRPRGRPRMDKYWVWEQVAEDFYEVIYRFIRRERAFGRLKARLCSASIIDRLGQVEPDLPSYLLTADVLQREFGLPITARQFYQRYRNRAKAWKNSRATRFDLNGRRISR